MSYRVVSGLGRVAVTLMLAGTTLTTHAADDWPKAQPIKLVVGYPPGGGIDFVARVVSEKLSAHLGQNLIVENKPGASGLLGAQSVVRAKPDGYTVLISSPAEVLISAIAGQRLPYDAARDLTPVSLVGDVPVVIAAKPELGVRNIQDLVDMAKAGKELTFGSPGLGGPSHFAGESINHAANINMLHVPYKGAADESTALLGGQISVAILGVPSMLPFLTAGKVRLLAITSKTRSALLPDVPAATEFPGLEDVQFSNWVGAYVPAGTPQPIVERLSSALHAVMQDPAVVARLQEQGVQAIGSTPAQFQAYLQQEKTRYEAVAQSRQIKLQ